MPKPWLKNSGAEPAPTVGAPRGGVIVWALAQLTRFAWLLVQIVLLGGLVAMLRRRFHYRAALVALATLVVGVTGLAMLFLRQPERFGDLAQGYFWASAMVVYALGGFFAGRVGRRVGYWECYLAVLVAAGLAYVQLYRGWDSLLGFGLDGRQSYFEVFSALQPGRRMLGEQWERLLVLGSLAGFLLSLFGGSLAYLFYSESGSLDASFSLERVIGVRHLRAQRRGVVSVTAAVAIVGVAVGVAALITVTAVMSGYQEDVQAKILSTNAHLVVQKYGVDFTEHDKVAKKALEVPGVLAATPFTFSEATLAYGDHGTGVMLKGVVPETSGEVTGVLGNLCAEVTRARCVPFPDSSAKELVTLLAPVDGVPSIVLGYELWKRLELPLGTRVALTTPVGAMGLGSQAPKRLEFRVGGVFRSGMHEFDSHLVYLELGSSQRLLGAGAAVNGVEIRVSEPERVEAVASAVLRAVGRYPYRTLDWRELNRGIFEALTLQKIVFFLVLAFIIVVAAFNIASTLFMAVVEKARDIGVLKSMGARDASIMKIFVLEGWIVGGIGTALGLFTGLVVSALIARLDINIAADVYMVETLTVRVRAGEVLVTAVAALVISHLATLYPALKAARQAPVDAMRYE